MNPPPSYLRFLRFLERYTKTDMAYLASGGTWLVTGQILTLAISFAVIVAFGHLAPQDLYGNYKYVLSLTGLLGAFSLAGIATALIRSAAKGYDGSLRQGFRLSLLWTGGASILSFLVAGYYFFFQADIFLGTSFIIVAVCMPFLNSFALFDPFLMGKQRFAQDTRYLITSAAFSAICVIVALFVTDRAIIVILVYFLANTFINGVLFMRTASRTPRGNNDPDLFPYSANLSVMGVLNTVADRIDSIIIFAFLGPVQLAVYTFAIALPEQLKLVTRLLTPLSIPRFATQDIGHIRRNIWRRILLLAGILLVLVVIYMLVAPLLFRLLFPLYVDAIHYTRWYALSVVLMAPIVPLISILQAHKRTRDLYLTSNLSSLVLLISLPLLTYFYGIAGAIGSQFVYRATNAALLSWRFLLIREEA